MPQTLLGLPNETILIIVEQLDQDKHDPTPDFIVSVKTSLRGLAATNRLLRKLCLPYLFSNVGFYYLRTAQRLLDVLNTNPELLKCIRNLVIGGGAFRYSDAPNSIWFDKFCELGPKIGPRLKGIAIGIGCGLLRHPQAVERLSSFVRSVELLNITYAEGVAGFVDLQRLLSETSNLRRIYLRLEKPYKKALPREDSTLIRTLVPSTVRKLSVKGHSFLLQTYAAWISNTVSLSSLAIAKAHVSLKSLSEFSDAMLSISQNLLELDIGDISLDSEVTPRNWTSLVLKITKSCTRLNSLNLQCIFCDVELITSLPPTLRALRITGWRMRRDRNEYDELCTAVLSLPARGLECIDIFHGSYVQALGDLDDEAEIQLRRSIPSAHFRDIEM